MSIIPPVHMRPATNERNEAEHALETAGWIRVSLPKYPGDNAELFVQMLKWCEDQIGAGRVEIAAGRINNGDRWYSYGWYGYWNFWFQFEQDATAFTLRWR